MAKRSPGDGTIYQQKDGLWCTSLRIDGRRKYFRSKSKREAERKLRQAQAEQYQGTLTMLPSQRVDAYLNSWLDNHVRPSLEATTVESYALNVRRAIPHIGRERLDKLHGERLQHCYRQLLNDGLSPRSVAQVHRVLRAAFNHAMSAGLIARNPCKQATPPRADRRPMSVLTGPQVQQFISDTTSHPLHALFVLLLTTGMRIGEANALTWDSVELESGRAVIRRTVRRERGRGMQFADPKTDRSRRAVYLSTGAVAALRRHQWLQKSERLKVGPAWTDDNLVFCTSTGGRLDPGRIRKTLHSLLKSLGLPEIRTHDLRHTAATYLLTQGVHPKVVQELLGHSSVMVTLDTYSHVLEGLHRDVARRMDELFQPAQKDTTWTPPAPSATEPPVTLRAAPVKRSS